MSTYIKELSRKEKKSLAVLGEELAVLQRSIIAEKGSVCILIDGWENSGKGEVISRLTQELDPRYYEVVEMPSHWEAKHSHRLFRSFWAALPRKGHITIFDRSIYNGILHNPEISEKTLDGRLEDLTAFIRMLTDDGMIVIKLFLQISHDEQKNRIRAIEKTEFKKEILSTLDYDQEKRYADFADHFAEIISRTNRLYSQWHMIAMDDMKDGCRAAMSIVKDELTAGLDAFRSLQALNAASREEKTTAEIASYPSAFPANLTLEVAEQDYRQRLKELQEKARRLAYMMYICHIPTICVFEGMDAAGKGGSIKRLTKEIDPRSYTIATTAAPTAEELSFHYLRRFMTKIPEPGKITIFDRSWYGRVMVERVERLAAPREWRRAYEEINAMERFLKHIGVNFMKFFLVIDSEEQLRRFNDRQNTPEKQWKITDEDWRNRDKWDLYNDAYQEMFYRTSTSTAPWIIVEGNVKYHARLKVLHTFVTQSERKLRSYEANHAKEFNWKNLWNEYETIGT